MVCPTCGNDVAAPGRCPVCGTDVSGTGAGDTVASSSAPAPDAETRLATKTEVSAASLGQTGRTAIPNSGPLQVGQNFGARYHVIRPLGIGGMGAVYQAWDQELEVAVAIKVIRPDVTADPAAAQDLERRFKRELLLARQVTHKNVVRIHDIGEIDGIKYITMPFVHGADLASILRRDGRLPIPRALSLARQIVAGLVAAHDAGVVHRDLKPANIMVDAEDHALIMDFGIARSATGTGGFAATVAGAVIGTVEYMAPEQAKGLPADQRADIYALGLIVYDMLRGGRHAGATTAVAELMSRMQHAPPSLRTQDPQIPEAVDAVITRCLQPEPVARYQTSADLLRDLDRASEGQAIAPPPTTTVVVERPSGAKKYLIPAAAALGLLLIAGGAAYYLSNRPSTPKTTAAVAAPSGPAVSLAVLPFRNASGDSSLDSLGTSLSEVLATDLGESSQVRTIPSDRLHQVLGDLQIARSANLSPGELARIAEFANAQTILWGQFVKFGDEIRIDATLQDLAQRKTTPLKATAPSQSALLTTIAELAASVQQSLAAGSADVLNELKSTAWRPSTQSFEALRQFNEGQQFERDGNYPNAIQRFTAATAEDPNFALAYSALAQAYRDSGSDAQAAQFSRRAVGLSGSLPPQEKYLIAATHYRITNDAPKAIETYEQLVKVSPNNPRIQYELAGLYEQAGQLDKAQEHYQRVVQLDPKYVDGLTAVGRVAILRGDPQASLDPLTNALSLSIQLNNDVARGNVLQAMGVAYKRLGRPNDALKNYQESLAIRRQLGQKRAMARSLSEIGQIQEQLGSPNEAVKSYNDALTLQREIGDKSGISSTLNNLGALLTDVGKPDEALPLLRESLGIARDDGRRTTESLALNNIGTAYLGKGQYSDAQTYFERALELREQSKVPREIADTLHNLGETLNKMGKYDLSISRYLRALEMRRSDGDKRGEAIESYSIGAIFDYQGRYGAAVKSKGEALKVFRDLKQKDFWYGEILSGYGYSAALAGRLDDAAKALDEASGVAKDLKNQGLIAQVLRFQAVRLSLAGDPRAAIRTSEQSAQAATRASDRTLDLWARAEVAVTAAAAQPTRALAATLASIASQADVQGLTYLSVYASLQSADTHLRTGNFQQARQDVERTLARAETLGLRELQARAEYVLASALRAAKDPQARRHYATAQQLFDEMKRDDGNQKVLERADVKAIYAECVQWSKAS
jgi:eukaryotic-like serine/threonine-protein kinase